MMPPNNGQSPEAREALRIAAVILLNGIGMHATTRLRNQIAAALLEARADGMQTVVDGTKGGNYWSVGAQRLRAEAQQLRGKGE